MFCPQCGNQTQENEIFCRCCGHRLREQAYFQGGFSPVPTYLPAPVMELSQKNVSAGLCLLMCGLIVEIVFRVLSLFMDKLDPNVLVILTVTVIGGILGLGTFVLYLVGLIFLAKRNLFFKRARNFFIAAAAVTLGEGILISMVMAITERIPAFLSVAILVASSAMLVLVNRSILYGCAEIGEEGLNSKFGKKCKAIFYNFLTAQIIGFVVATANIIMTNSELFRDSPVLRFLGYGSFGASIYTIIVYVFITYAVYAARKKWKRKQ